MDQVSLRPGDGNLYFFDQADHLNNLVVRVALVVALKPESGWVSPGSQIPVPGATH